MRISDWSSDVCSSDLGEDDFDVGFVQGAGFLHRPRRRDDDGNAALVVADAGADGAPAFPGESLKGRVRLEHRVEMADEENALALPAALGGCDEERESVSEGRSGAVRVDLGGRRIMK